MRIASSSLVMESSRYFNQISFGRSGSRENISVGSSFANTARQYLTFGNHSSDSANADAYSLYGGMTGGRYRFNMINHIKDADALEESEAIEENAKTGVDGERAQVYNTGVNVSESNAIEKAQMKVMSSYEKIRFSLLELILRRFEKYKGYGEDYQADGYTEGSYRTVDANFGGVYDMSGMSSIYDVASNGQIVRTDRMLTYSESEYTSFSAQGIAKTEDGREIEFGINISMSRSFRQYTEITTPVLERSLTDPLVINVDSEVAQISEQKFLFDLDADGKEEEISMTEKGSGFLALDLNDDGKINDGSELFGTKSGDGFADLAQYDSDGNGWIDENDSVYNLLKIWYKDENGKDVLINLKEADIGAIALENCDTEFSLMNGTGDIDGKIRRTGVYLKESGGVGSVQHVDLAMNVG